MIPRPKYIKGKGYCPNPIVVYGIPPEADSKNYPNVWGTSAWEQFWIEQLYYIHNGYQTGGLWIPGRYYYYMNFTVMNDPDLGAINPDNTDLHLELAYFIDYCKKNGKNLMIPKGRRRGISEASHPMIIDYGYRFSPDKWQGGVAAGHSLPINDFITKWQFAETNLPAELYIGTLKADDKEIKAGWDQKNELNSWQEYGVPSTIYLRTMGKNPNMFKGLYLKDVVVEEVGEFENFMEFWRGTKETLMSGQKQVGSAFVYGTGGRIDKGSRDFKKAWEIEDDYDWCKANNFERFVVDGRRFYFFGGASSVHKRLPEDSELYKLYKPYQLIGVEDTEAAEKDILKRRKELLDNHDLAGYNTFVQENPINEQEIFRKTGTNNFDTLLINNQIDTIRRMPNLPYSLYRLEWVKDSKTGMLKQPLEVQIIPLKSHEDQTVCVKIIDGPLGLPNKNYTNRTCAGIDSYNVDQSNNSKSLGGMCVLDRVTKMPIAIIRCRPKVKETFYELCLKLSVYYGMMNNVLGDIASDGIINHFNNAGCYGYLADRPKKLESLTSEQKHSKWMRLTTYSKGIMIGFMQFHLNNHHDKILFPELLSEIADYDEETVESDNDLADAYGIALCQDFQFEVKPRDESENAMPDRFVLPTFVDDGRGGMRLKGATESLKHIQQDNPMFGMLFGSDRE